MTRSVFISHSSLDKATADQVCTFLEDRGIACWIAPRNMPPGAKFGEAIVDALENASALLLLFSESVNTSEHVMNEVERAVHQKLPIFPLKLDHAEPSRELAYFISRRHWLDAKTAPLDVRLNQLAVALSPLVTSNVPPLPQHEAAPPKRVGPGERNRCHESESVAGGKRRLAVVIVVLLLVLLAGSVTLVVLRREPPEVPSPALAYQVLERRDWAQAQTLFQKLSVQAKPGIQSQGYAGLAAVAFAQDDFQQALDFATKAEAVDSEVVYSHVIRGHIDAKEGKIEAAKLSYRTAMNNTNGLPCQQAIAAHHLGRIYADEGFYLDARKYYDRAISQCPRMAAEWRQLSQGKAK